MTESDRKRLSDEWDENEKRIQSLPVNHAERRRLEKRQDETKYLLAEDEREETNAV